MPQQVSIAVGGTVQAPIAFPVDIDHVPVQVALPATGVNPVSADWHLGVWVRVGARGTSSLYAQLQVGPFAGQYAYLAGAYDLWVQSQDTTTIPAYKADTVRVA